MAEFLAVAAAFWILGLLQGYYARSVYNRVEAVYLLFKDRLETPSGVVKPERTRGPTRTEPINLEADSGAVMRPSPDEVIMQSLKHQNKRLKEL